MKFSIKEFTEVTQETMDSVIFTEEALNRKLHFFVQCNKQMPDSNFSLILIMGIFVLKRII